VSAGVVDAVVVAAVAVEAIWSYIWAFEEFESLKRIKEEKEKVKGKGEREKGQRWRTMKAKNVKERNRDWKKINKWDRSKKENIWK